MVSSEGISTMDRRATPRHLLIKKLSVLGNLANPLLGLVISKLGRAVEPAAEPKDLAQRRACVITIGE